MWVDHISLDGSIEAVRDLGFAVTPTAGGGHARVHLGGVYLEVSDGGVDSRGLVGTAWFLRPADIAGCVEQLRPRGVGVSDVSVYHGRDGEWLDARIPAPALGAGVPALTRRVSPIAQAWPPALSDAHPNGVRALRAVHVGAAEPDRLMRLLTLVGAHHDGDDAVHFDDGVRIVVESVDHSGQGPVAVVLDRGAEPPLWLSLTS